MLENKSNEKTAVMFGKYDISDRLIHATNLAIAFPAWMPILPGHVLVCPKRIVEKFEELSIDERKELFYLLSNIKMALKKAFHAEGFNIAWNEGVIAGQSVPHMHIHIIPRREGDGGIVDYEPREFLYRPGVREISPPKELSEVAQMIAGHLPK